MTLESELAALQQPLMRFAQLQLRNTSMAEDVVSETMLAILEKPGSFEGRSSLRTYATGILKFKIIDVLRKRGREVHIEPMDEQSMDDALDALFEADGHWHDAPTAWGAVAPGAWVLAFRGAAVRVLSAAEAAATNDALDALAAVLAGDVAAGFADLVDREPVLPPHLRGDAA